MENTDKHYQEYNSFNMASHYRVGSLEAVKSWMGYFCITVRCICSVSPVSFLMWLCFVFLNRLKYLRPVIMLNMSPKQQQQQL
jgi:hypothetical protein